MSFPSPFARSSALLSAVLATFLPGGALLRRLAMLALALAGLQAGVSACAAELKFDGRPIDTCHLADKVYTCPQPAHPSPDDTVVIADGYTLEVKGSVAVGPNQGLKMSGTARLVVSGDLNLASVKPGKLQVSGGSIEAGGAISIGANASIRANVTGGNVYIGSSARITGHVNASSAISLASHSSVDGDVDSHSLYLQASDAHVTGSAYVATARLDSGGRVSGTIYCKNGTAQNKCDCVTNYSGHAVNMPGGPTCASPATSLHHLVITHDGSGDTCVPESLTVKACADAACSALHTGGVRGRINPFGTALWIPRGQSSTQVSATYLRAEKIMLGIASPSPMPASGASCIDSSTGARSCNMSFTGGVKLLIDVGDHVAGVLQDKAIQAVRANPQATACVPAFANAIHDVRYACTYNKPAAGGEQLRLNGADLVCNVPGQARSTTFDKDGRSPIRLAYGDAGEMMLSASIDTGRGVEAQGSVRFTTVPARFALAQPAGPLRAGADFTLEVKALNAAGTVTKNFDTARLDAAGASGHAVAVNIDCLAQGGAAGTLDVKGVRFANGVAMVPLNWSEVGRIDLKASLAGFMGIPSLGAAGTTDGAAAGCSGAIGPFIPQYFKVELAETGVQAGRAFYYSKEPFTLKVSAMNSQGTVTENYSADLGLSEGVALAAVDAGGAAFASPPGSLSVTGIAASSFAGGVATARPAYAFGSTPARPTRIRLRATNAKATGTVSSHHGGAPEAAETGAMPEIRSGRLRIANAFGSRGSRLSLPVMAEYWTGSSWLLNTDDSYTTIPASAFAITSTRQPGSTPATVPFQVRRVGSAGLALVNGVGPLVVDEASGGSGWADIAVNLGPAGAMKDNACLLDRPDSTPAAREWLRAAHACRPGDLVDPSGRATFGVFAPETRRIIHVREVFR
ncbi:DUF6701 domain-containing protein [Massilia consociata]|uniref:DUF6701 domain-containing protein n=1 Tax=Massilia consociata TaxID=760117 RepID=A0ABV6FJ14_9BURK